MKSDNRVPVCAECGSQRVWSDAVAFFNRETQDWDIAEANEVHFGCNQCSHDDVSIKWLDLIPIHSYLNTQSEAGLPETHFILPDEVCLASCWTNSYGNPTWVLHMTNGDTHLMPDAYGATNGLPNTPTRVVRRRKELF